MSVVVGHAHGQKPHATTSPVCAEVCVVDVQTEPSCRGCSVECFAFENRDAGRRVRMCQQQNVYQNNIDSIEPMWRAMSFRKAMGRMAGSVFALVNWCPRICIHVRERSNDGCATGVTVARDLDSFSAYFEVVGTMRNPSDVFV